MRNILTLSLVLLLSGCGEKFDASSDSMIKISYNSILKGLDDDAERGDFERQFALYTQPYQVNVCMEDCTEKNDIEFLHGLSYAEVIETVDEHEKKLYQIEREAATMALERLHKEWLTSTSNITQREADLTIKINDKNPAAPRGFFYKNNSGKPITKHSICFSATKIATGEEVAFDCVKLGGIFKPGESHTGDLRYFKAYKYIDNENYSVYGMAADVLDENGEDMYPIMSDQDFSNYQMLRNSYVDIFEEVEKKQGKAPWYM